MRLIDADATMEMDNETAMKHLENDCDYDLDKVVEELEDHAIEFEAFGICSDYVELSHAIEIVKCGGVSGEK